MKIFYLDGIDVPPQDDVLQKTYAVAARDESEARMFVPAWFVVNRVYEVEGKALATEGPLALLWVGTRTLGAAYE